MEAPMDLLFKGNLTFHDDRMNLTIRRGVKWSFCSVGDIVNVSDADNRFEITEDGKHRDITKPIILFKAKIVGTKLVRFCDLFDNDLEYEHDPNCRTVDGLSKVLSNIYPLFDRRELVTLVYFDRLFNA